ncbi:MAG: DNA-binding protein WhiA [Clostridiales Family XIII bacterium]|jgi:DNA-binding protein WhiA|nr:DNA-binding protein WhiA [Clostridiales Family XIII bacterium]
MSFSSDTKNELAHIPIEKDCCAHAELSGFMRGAASVSLVGLGRLGIVAKTDNNAIARRIKSLLANLYKEPVRLMIGDNPFDQNIHEYQLVIDPSEAAKKIIARTGMMRFTGGETHMRSDIDKKLVATKCCRKAYIRGLFLGAGSINDPEKSYHLEYVLSSDEYAKAVRRLISTFTDLHAQTCKRRNDYIVYNNRADEVGDLLSLMGAHAQVLKYENTRIIKEVRGHTNRISNCDNANVDRAIQAAIEQTEAIASLDFNLLSDDLKIVAQARLENEDLNATELAIQLSEGHHKDISKSWVQYRLKKLVSLARDVS